MKHIHLVMQLGGQLLVCSFDDLAMHVRLPHSSSAGTARGLKAGWRAGTSNIFIQLNTNAPE